MRRLAAGGESRVRVSGCMSVSVSVGVVGVRRRQRVCGEYIGAYATVTVRLSGEGIGVYVDVHVGALAGEYADPMSYHHEAGTPASTNEDHYNADFGKKVFA